MGGLGGGVVFFGRLLFRGGLVGGDLAGFASFVWG